ncbi:hypothetical protein B0H13DRAFT_2300695 [Mycena leptocephala]|nr:hypothetical protein B0H13DRAFT_2300695 [Mycena leptocephala]
MSSVTTQIQQHSIPEVGGVPTSYIEAEWTPDGGTLDNRGRLEKRNRVNPRSLRSFQNSRVPSSKWTFLGDVGGRHPHIFHVRLAPHIWCTVSACMEYSDDAFESRLNLLPLRFLFAFVFAPFLFTFTSKHDLWLLQLVQSPVCTRDIKATAGNFISLSGNVAALDDFCKKIVGGNNGKVQT